MNFSNISPTLARALSEHNYLEPTPVQAAVLAKGHDGRDLLVSAQTGSGKTVAYGLAIAPDILDPSGMLGDQLEPAALVIAPTRELALQVERELRWLYAPTGARIVACVGGMNPQLERRRLNEGAHIVVGTPGRLRDHIERGALVLKKLAAAVLDEADEMLDMGFREDLEFILDATPQERRTLLFSATIPKGIATLAKSYQRDAMRIEVAGGERGHADIEYRAIRVAPREHEHVVVNLLRAVDAQTAIIFSNTRESVRHLQAFLQERGFSAVLLSGELSQHERNQSMQALRDGRARVCVATDVAARGLDLPNLGLVIHAEIPHDAETLQHRSGRTGRAGKKGVSAILVPPHRRRRVDMLLRDAGVRVHWSGPPTIEEIRVLDRERIAADPVFSEAPEDEDIAIARMLMEKHSAEQLCASLVRFYRSRLPAIEEVTDPGDGPPRRERDRERQDSFEPRGDRKPFEPRENRENRDRSLGDGVWFRLDVGRKKNADPKWILPMLCRNGGITRKDIGVIRIFDTDSRVEISASVADEFQKAMRRPGGENIRVDRLGAEGPAPENSSQDRPRQDNPRQDRPRQDRPRQDSPPRQEKPSQDRPRQDKPRQAKHQDTHQDKPHQPKPHRKGGSDLGGKPKFEAGAKPKFEPGAKPKFQPGGKPKFEGGKAKRQKGP